MTQFIPVPFWGTVNSTGTRMSCIGVLDTKKKFEFSHKFSDLYLDVREWG